MNVILKLVLAFVVGFSFTSLEAQKKTIGSVERLSDEMDKFISIDYKWNCLTE